MSERVVYMGGEWVPESQAKVSIYDLSVAQGAAAFEMTRSFNGVVFKLQAHLKRLQESCEALGLVLPYTLTELTRLCYETQERNVMEPTDEHRLMIVVSPGVPSMYKHMAGTIYGPWVYIADFPLRYTVEGMAPYYHDGVNLVTSSVRQINSQAIPATAKHRSRLHFYRAQVETSPAWALMLDEDGDIAECPGANVAAVCQDTFYTIGPNSLRGISFAYAKVCASEVGMNTSHWSPDIPLHKADEVWITGTPFCMLPVGCIDKHVIGTGKPGRWYKRVLNKWSDNVGVRIAEQVEQWDNACVTK